jgi:hypothetical protein
MHPERFLNVIEIINMCSCENTFIQFTIIILYLQVVNKHLIATVKTYERIHPQFLKILILNCFSDVLAYFSLNHFVF